MLYEYILHETEWAKRQNHAKLDEFTWYVLDVFTFRRQNRPFNRLTAIESAWIRFDSIWSDSILPQAPSEVYVQCIPTIYMVQFGLFEWGSNVSWVWNGWPDLTWLENRIHFILAPWKSHWMNGNRVEGTLRRVPSSKTTRNTHLHENCVRCFYVLGLFCVNIFFCVDNRVKSCARGVYIIIYRICIWNYQQ